MVMIRANCLPQKVMIDTDETIFKQPHIIINLIVFSLRSGLNVCKLTVILLIYSNRCF